MLYNWQRSDWPQFVYDLASIERELIQFADKAGQVSGLLRSLDHPTQLEAVAQVMITEALQTSEIEGEQLNPADVMSSVRNQLGINQPAEPTTDAASAGAGQLMVAVRKAWDEDLNEPILFAWHRLLMQGHPTPQPGRWRTHTEPMQVVSGPIGRQKVHFEAPPSSAVPHEMQRFFRWFNHSRTQILHAPVRAALVHLYFESIHPFEDGNGRIGRALAEKALSQGLGRPALLSLSRAIQENKSAYYEALQQAQRSNEVSAWIAYFSRLTLTAQTRVEELVSFTLRKAQFFTRYESELNERQLQVVRRMWEAGPEGFAGGMNARKYISLTQVSKATATRDLQQLAALGVLQAVGRGRSARYELAGRGPTMRT
ncbi:MAG: filamentation induced by cAMP protein fic [Puniceicoccaceae bacterium 5H]|nr:MAG: filamentation induced by cAMP protein fic [Puniceicoccaceae bacterium 5H]